MLHAPYSIARDWNFAILVYMQKRVRKKSSVFLRSTGNYSCWQVLEVPEEHWRLALKAEEQGWSSLTLILVCIISLHVFIIQVSFPLLISNLQVLKSCFLIIWFYLYWLFTERAKSLANAVSGEAHHFEDLRSFKPENGAILANATPIGMHPNTDRIPVAEVAHTYMYLTLRIYF